MVLSLKSTFDRPLQIILGGKPGAVPSESKTKLPTKIVIKGHLQPLWKMTHCPKILEL